jgi:hypothetical protein
MQVFRVSYVGESDSLLLDRTGMNDLILTTASSVSAAVYSFGSELCGLIGVARRNTAFVKCDIL